MKKIFIIIIVFVPFLTACQEWLDEHPKAVAAETFYNTPAEADAGVLAPLFKMRHGFTENSFCSMVQSFADYSYSRGSWTTNSDYEGLNTQNASRSYEIWIALYRAVKDCNIAIARLPEATGMSEEQIKAYLGELRFLRALNYYYLVRSYGALPLRTDKNMLDYNMAKSPVSDIYALIVEDLEYASANCPVRERIVGTPSRWAAKSLLGQVYLQLKDYTKAQNLLKEVVDSKRYSLVPVSGSREFEKIFGPNVVNTTEEVFYIHNTHTDSNDSYWNFITMCAHPNATINGRPMLAKGDGFFGHYTRADNKVIAEWDDADLRKEFNILPFDLGMGVPTCLLVKYYDPDAPSGIFASNSYPLFIRYPDVLMHYAEAITMVKGAPDAVAMEQINVIHRRAYGYDPNVGSAVDFRLEDYATKELFMDLIVKENAYETFNEAKRWFFLLRLGIAEKVIKEVKGKDIAAKHYLFPIPPSEFTYNKALDPAKDQNPGY